MQHFVLLQTAFQPAKLQLLKFLLPRKPQARFINGGATEQSVYGRR
jgi:hypothetical protein